MSSMVQVRNVPDEARRVLKARASARGESLNTYMLRLIARDVARPTVAEVFDRAAARGQRVRGSSTDAVAEGREERDQGWVTATDA